VEDDEDDDVDEATHDPQPGAGKVAGRHRAAVSGRHHRGLTGRDHRRLRGRWGWGRRWVLHLRVSYSGLSKLRSAYAAQSLTTPTTRQALAPPDARGQAPSNRLRPQHRSDTGDARSPRVPEGLPQVGPHTPGRPGARRKAD